jgi:hypothetical protein
MNPEPTSSPLRIGRYLLFGQIAAGGMASVHLGRPDNVAGAGTTLAIKRPHPHLVSEGEFLAMLLDEARVAARLRHPNVVRTYEAVWVDGQALLVMEYVPGVALSLLLRRVEALGEAVPSAIAASIARDMLRGLHAAHEAVDARGQLLGLVHRDISPQNILISDRGVAKVADFGIAKAAGRILQTQEGELKGKLAYMAPEQLCAGHVDCRADVYSAAIVIWEMLTGRSLFLDENGEVVVARLIDHKPEAPSKVTSTLPQAWDAIVMRGLARDARERFGTADEMARAIETSVPLATPAEVAEWVALNAADVLAQRRAMCAMVEAPDGVERTLTDFGDASFHAGGVAARAPGDRRGRATLLAGAAALALVALGVTTVRARVGEGTVAAAQAAPVESWEHAPAAPHANVLQIDPAALDAAAAQAPALPQAALAASEPAALPKPVAARASARRTVTANAAPKCSPPYDLDARGVKHYKAECL